MGVRGSKAPLIIGAGPWAKAVARACEEPNWIGGAVHALSPCASAARPILVLPVPHFSKGIFLTSEQGILILE